MAGKKLDRVGVADLITSTRRHLVALSSLAFILFAAEKFLPHTAAKWEAILSGAILTFFMWLKIP